MRNVILYGALRKKFGRSHRLSVSSPAEALRALDANFDGFESSLRALDEKNMGVRIVIGKRRLKRIDDIDNPCSGDIKIIPTVMGAKSGMGQIFAAIVIAAAVYFTAGAAAGAFGATTGAAITSAGYGLALSMAIGGIAQMLTSTPKVNNVEKNDSKTFSNGPANISAQGSPVPIGYGRLIVGSAVISSGISIDQEGTNQASEIGGIYPKPDVAPPTLIWNKDASRWDEMDGTPLSVQPDHMPKGFDSVYWRTTDGRAPYFNIALNRWDLPDPRDLAIWNGRTGRWCMYIGLNVSGPEMLFDETNKCFSTITQEDWLIIYPPTEQYDSGTGGN